jgi:hypothetical protein
MIRTAIIAPIERLAGTRARGVLAGLERSIGAFREVGWKPNGEVRWDTTRGVLAKIERCAGKDKDVKHLVTWLYKSLKLLPVFKDVDLLIVFNNQQGSS